MSVRQSGPPRALTQRSSLPPRYVREPLSARRPAARPPARHPARGKRSLRVRLAGASRLYGWRLYAIPVLMALTVLVVVQTVRGDSGGVAAAAGAQQDGAAPLVVEQPPTGVDLTSDTAALPTGGPYTKHGAGSWHVVPGTSHKVGSGGPLRSYSVAVEDGLDAAEYGGDKAFADMVQTTLSDPRSWIGGGTVSLRRVDGATHADFQVALTSTDTEHHLCGAQIKYESSCYNSSRGQVVINIARWVRGAKAFNGDLGTYRQYAINHEVGHALGQHHVGCTTDGALAPVMMQQTFGVSDNYVYRLNQRDPSNSDAIAKDGKVCKPNAWPVLGERAVAN